MCLNRRQTELTSNLDNCFDIVTLSPQLMKIEKSMSLQRQRGPGDLSRVRIKSAKRKTTYDDRERNLNDVSTSTSSALSNHRKKILEF
ncbi:hypothetical protein AVEN_19661-1 [Araneus ventricosus]|uniref:Uncharacterized protein n=1 Tax=Araneus ventricosus TaxID=182803 RepID=A0A4Y2C3B8_ARAVE|nr:hypothetical protein AVEN_19661-1 [Araneus ventricosus]